MEIYTLGADVLLQKAVPVQDFGNALEEYIEKMFTLMYDGKGIGLAAPQVGRGDRFFICHITGDR